MRLPWSDHNVATLLLLFQCIFVLTISVLSVLALEMCLASFIISKCIIKMRFVYFSLKLFFFSLSFHFSLFSNLSNMNCFCVFFLGSFILNNLWLRRNVCLTNRSLKHTRWTRVWREIQVAVSYEYERCEMLIDFCIIKTVSCFFSFSFHLFFLVFLKVHDWYLDNHNIIKH